MKYNDEEQSVQISKDSNLFEYNIKAEGKTFDVTTTKKQLSIATSRNTKSDITWYNGRQISSPGTKKVTLMIATTSGFMYVTHAEK
ncbi:hypothetical protein C2G38_2242010 [Gigaspora rosea]|uniref:Uncharacterized protein n=1 Tax=Gigaspora rosea TaxID=44941 RepID=A0A397VT01_9GLOM|nr:hypothetical protein C2G38_2242010 [Gigaspora rosea]